MTMELRPIHTEADYDAALAEIEQYFDNEPQRGSPEAPERLQDDRDDDRLDPIQQPAGDRQRPEAHVGPGERQHARWRIDPPDNAVDAIQAVMEFKRYSQSDLAQLLGSRSRASEILNRKRGLTMEQARLLHEHWHVPAESLIAG